jgi:hypothetical protein
MEDKCLPVDVEFLKSISELNFVQEYNEYNRSLQQFMTLLNNHMKTGLLSSRTVLSYFSPILLRRPMLPPPPPSPPQTPD